MGSGISQGARKRGSNKLDGALRTSFISIFILQVFIEHYILARFQMLALSTWNTGFGLQETYLTSQLWSHQGHVQSTSHLLSDLKEQLEWERLWRVKMSKVCL